ncbi:MAG: hypothetical protein D5R99_02205 [Methanocalculus sp. MSAO_Arc1]|nr:MAG: hypothetical protein D5R99_02205 [Methanocalculus sp. MSAO_Arc1]
MGGVPLLKWERQGAFTIDILHLKEIQCNLMSAGAQISSRRGGEPRSVGHEDPLHWSRKRQGH